MEQGLLRKTLRRFKVHLLAGGLAANTAQGRERGQTAAEVCEGYTLRGSKLSTLPPTIAILSRSSLTAFLHLRRLLLPNRLSMRDLIRR